MMKRKVKIEKRVQLREKKTKRKRDRENNEYSRHIIF